MAMLQRRQALREKLQLDQFESDSEAHESGKQKQAAAQPSSVSVHHLGQYSAVVTVEPFNMHSER